MWSAAGTSPASSAASAARRRRRERPRWSAQAVHMWPATGTTNPGGNPNLGFAAEHGIAA